MLCVGGWVQRCAYSEARGSEVGGVFLNSGGSACGNGSRVLFLVQLRLNN